MTAESDEQLVERWRKAADASAIATLADRYLGQFYGTARAMMLTKDDSQDIAQEAMLKVVRAIETFDASKSFRTWSYTILLNSIRSQRRRQKTYSQRLKAVDNIDGYADVESSRQAQFGTNETSQCIANALGKLTEKQRTALVMMVMEGHSAAEVAEMEGCSVDAIYQRVARWNESPVPRELMAHILVNSLQLKSTVQDHK